MNKLFITLRNLMVLLLPNLIFVFCEKEFDYEELTEDPNVIIASSQHLAFPDLTRYKNNWYLTFRMSDAHMAGSYSKIKVLKSQDFIKWEEINSIEYPDFDLRDPKFSYDELNDNFYLHFYARSRDYTNSLRKNVYLNYNKLKNSFDTDSVFNRIRMNENYPNDWLWRPIWRNGSMFAGGYSTGNIRFYKYESLDKLPRIFLRLYGANASESTLRFHNGNLYAIIRTNNKALFGFLPQAEDLLFHNYVETEMPINWFSLPIEQFGGPNMVIKDDLVVFGGRVNNKTSIFRYSWQNDNLELLQDLISYGIDNSYPGFYLLDNTIYGVYYTQTENLEGFMIRSFIIDLLVNSNEDE